MNNDITAYNNAQNPTDLAICDQLAALINTELTEAESKIWHSHPVWFLNDNPIVGYSKQKAGIRLIFWSGADFNEEHLSEKGKKFKDASVFYHSIAEIDSEAVKSWLQKGRNIQWDYKNLVKRKGQLERISNLESNS